LLKKEEAKALLRRMDIFEDKVKKGKQTQLVMIASMGIKSNMWSEEIVDQEVILEDLFSSD